MSGTKLNFPVIRTNQTTDILWPRNTMERPSEKPKQQPMNENAVLSYMVKSINQEQNKIREKYTNLQMQEIYRQREQEFIEELRQEEYDGERKNFMPTDPAGVE